MGTPETKQAFEEKYGCKMSISDSDDWNDMPDEDVICEVFVGDGLGFTDRAFYVNGKWFSYGDEEQTKPLNVTRWRKD